MTPELTIVVPAFNEAPRLADGMKRFEAAVESGAIDLEKTEIVVVDDGSTDATEATAHKLLAPYPHHRVIRHPANRGKGAAVRTGVATATGTYTAYMDADMAIDPIAVPLLLDGLVTHDVAVGSRALPASMVESTYALRAVMGRLFNQLVMSGTGLRLRDTQCGFKAFRTPVARGCSSSSGPSTASPSTSSSSRSPSASASGSPRCRSTGATSRDPPSTRSTTPSPCSPTSTGRASA